MSKKRRESQVSFFSFLPPMQLRMKRRRRKQLLSSVIIFTYFFTENKKEASLSINRIQAPASHQSLKDVFSSSRTKLKLQKLAADSDLFMMKTGPAETCKCWPELFRTKTIFERKKESVGVGEFSGILCLPNSEFWPFSFLPVDTNIKRTST